MITKLTHWSLNRVIPTIDDTESLSVLELVGRCTTKINELITNYNEFVDNVNLEIDTFENNLNSDFECFKNNLVKIIHEYIHSIDLKIDEQDKVLMDAVNFMKENIKDSVSTLISEMKENGELDEVILNSLDELNNKYETLYLAINNHDLLIDSINNKIVTLENTEYQLVYNATGEELMLQKVINGGE